MTQNHKLLNSCQGFSLLELLLVITIIAILSGVLFFSLIRSVHQNQLREASIQLSADLRKARLNAQKTGLDNTLEITDNSSDYTLKTGTQTPITRELPYGIKIFKVLAVTKIVYHPPYGTLDTNGSIWRISRSDSNDPQLFIKTVGITGKVIISASQN